MITKALNELRMGRDTHSGFYAQVVHWHLVMMAIGATK